MIPQYKDFFLTIDGPPGHYTVTAQGPDEVRVPPLPFVFDETEAVRVALNRIQSGYAPSRERMQQVGTMLFKALFPYEILPTFIGAKTHLPPGTHLRIKLIVRPPALSHLPWELTYDVLDRTFIAARTSRPIVRYVEQGTPPALLTSRRPLRVLYLQANPQSTTLLDAAASEGVLRQALGDAGKVTALHATTPSALRDVLREGTHHVLHYDGHGAFEGSGGHLYLHDAGGGTHKLSGEMLATYLDGSSIRLVVLSACQTAADATQKRFSGIAQQLMRTTRLPAVVAMQYEIPDPSAIAFTREFYQALADDYPIDAAVVEGRKAILETLGDDPFAQPDWATPVLFMRVQDGDIFRRQKEQRQMNEEKRDRDTRVDTGGGAYIGGGVNVSGGDFVGRDKVVHGDNINMSGDFRGANVNVKSTLTNVTQTIGALPGADPAAKAKLETLIRQLNDALQQVPPDKGEDAEAVAELAQQLVEKANKEKPNRTMVQVTGEGLKQAAQNLADVMPTVLTIATQIVGTIGQIVR
jgi:hypothetical protein